LYLSNGSPYINPPNLQPGRGEGKPRTKSMHLTLNSR